jgi:hypothetical protein
MNCLDLLYIVFFYRGIKFYQQRSNLVTKMSAREHATSEKVRESGNKLHTVWTYCLTTRISGLHSTYLGHLAGVICEEGGGVHSISLHGAESF